MAAPGGGKRGPCPGCAKVCYAARVFRFSQYHVAHLLLGTCVVMDLSRLSLYCPYPMAFQWASRRFLKVLTEVAPTTCWGRLFQELMTLWLEKFFLWHSKNFLAPEDRILKQLKLLAPPLWCRSYLWSNWKTCVYWLKWYPTSPSWLRNTLSDLPAVLDWHWQEHKHQVIN